MNDTTECGRQVRALMQDVRLRANSAIITVFGDMILPRGGNIWLGSLIALAAPLGIAERLVRTGVFRLSRQGWLTSQTRGRRSYYSLTRSGFEKFHEAQRRFYAVDPVPWDGEWRLVQLPAQIAQARRQALRRELGWLGCGQLGPTLFAHPTEDMAVIARILTRYGIGDKTLVFRARLAGFVAPAHVRGIVAEAWNLPALARDYRRFAGLFAPVERCLAAGQTMSDEDAFVLRILLMHEFRRILLKDPVLPDELLPADWPGATARSLTRAIYRRIAAAADRHLLSLLDTHSGKVPELNEEYRRRFGGMPA